MDEAEQPWSLKARELRNCPYYTEGDSIRVRMPGVHGDQPTICSMPVATFIPVAMENARSEGRIEAGWKDCACRWSYRRGETPAQAAERMEELLSAEDRMSRPFLEQLPLAVARAFRERAATREYRAGEVILAVDGASSHFHVILRGMVRIAGPGGDGRPLELSVLRKGDCFGEMSILTGAPASNQVDAVEDCLTLAVPRGEFHKLISEFPVMGIILYRMLSKRIKAANQKLSQLMSPGISGDLRFFPFTDLVQTVLAARLTGTLVVELAASSARFGFGDGELLRADLGLSQGAPVIDEALRWRSGAFRFLPGQAPAEANLEGDTMGILLEALRRMDESTVIEKAQGLAS